MTFTELLEVVGYTVRPYSGRGMYGKQCPSVDVSIGIVAGAIVDYEHDARLDPDTRAMVVRALRGAREDSLGRGVVTYFPTEAL
jgi:hypothetical protein